MDHKDDKLYTFPAVFRGFSILEVYPTYTILTFLLITSEATSREEEVVVWGQELCGDLGGESLFGKYLGVEEEVYWRGFRLRTLR